MSTFQLTILFVGSTFLLYAFIAWRSKANSTKDFYVAGGSVSPVANAMATAADFMSVATMLSVPGLVAAVGYDATPYLIGPAGGFFLLGILIAPYLRKFGKFTIPDFIGDRYYSHTARTIAVLCALIITTTYLAGQMRGVGVVFSRFLEVSIELGVVIGAFIVFLYAVWGGMKGITYTQVAQFCVLSFAFLIPIIFLSILLTNNALPWISWAGQTTGEEVFLLDKLDGLNEEFGFKAFTAQGRSTLDLFCLSVSLMVGTAGMPHIIIRYFTVPKVSDARRSVAYTLLFIGLIFTATAPLSAFARTYMLEALNGLPYNNVPDWFRTWEQTKLITFNDLNGDGIIQFVGGADNELAIDFDVTFLAIPQIANLSNWVVALVAAGALAAALSTAAGLLLVFSSSVSHDLVKKQLKPNISEQSELNIARLCAAGAVVIGIYFGINPPSFIIETVALAFGIGSATFFPAIFLGIFFKSINREGAIAGMLVGLVFSLSYIIYFQFMDGDKEHLLLDISAQGIGTIGMVLNFITSIVVSRFYKDTPQEIQDLVESIRYPKSPGEALRK